MATKKKTTTKKRFKPYCETTTEKTKQQPTEEPKLHAVKMKLEYTILVYGTKDEINETLEEESNSPKSEGILMPDFSHLDWSGDTLTIKSKAESIKEIKTIKELESRADLAKYDDNCRVEFLSSGSIKYENEDSEEDIYREHTLRSVIRVEKIC
jgi:hypothetical protein